MEDLPLIEKAVIYRQSDSSDPSLEAWAAISTGTLKECLDILRSWQATERAGTHIDLADGSRRFDRPEIEEILAGEF